MAQEIEFSVMAPNPDGIQPLLEQFEAEYKIHVRLRLLAWDSAWSMFVRSALYNDGPDVSEVGTTWIGDLVGMNALRPFGAAEVAAFGKASAFIPPAWKTATQYGDARVWSIPWLTGARLVFYRPALFQRLGLDPASAFQSLEQVERTIQSLQEHGVRYPWSVPTGYTHTTLLNAASWVWAAGGDFLSPDGRSTRFTRPEALAGLQAYFALGKYLASPIRHLNGLEPDELFLSDPSAAATLSGPWLFCRARVRLADHMPGQVGVALPPGASFVGGSNLIVWKYSHHTEAAIKLVHFLTTPAVQVAYCQHIGLLPARLEALAAEPFASDPYWQMAIAGLKSGQTFPLVRLWGLVEDRLAAGLSAVWAELLAAPQADITQVLVKHLGPIAERLDRVLGSA